MELWETAFQFSHQMDLWETDIQFSHQMDLWETAFSIFPTAFSCFHYEIYK